MIDQTNKKFNKSKNRTIFGSWVCGRKVSINRLTERWIGGWIDT